MTATTRSRTQFFVEIIKPSHYDDDGYVIQWVRGFIPSNSLACLYALVHSTAERRVLGVDVDVVASAYDETTTVIPVSAIIRRIKQGDGRGLVLMAGVQSNQFPRAADLAHEFRAAGIAVAVGGFHVSGCLAMLPDLPPEVRALQADGVTLFAGEAEGRMDQLLADAFRGQMQPAYNFLNDLPDLRGQVTPFLPPDTVRRCLGTAPFDAGRGCPFQCSFCTIINVQGRKSRYRTPDDVEAIVRANAGQGITRFFITDDNFARNRNWEPILDRLIALREREGFNIRLLLQVDTLCHRIAGFIQKSARAGCTAVFIGLENINPESLMGTKKRQNKIWEYRDMLLAWRAQKVMTYAGYILGFPTDTPESIARDIEIIKKELPIDILEFFYLTPLPGSEDHKNLFLRGVPMDPDMNKYDLEHACTGHPLMSKETWDRVYADAWRRYYTDEHVETIVRRALVSGINRTKVLDSLIIFSGAARIEGVHPLQFGFLRRKLRRQRRYGMPVVHPFAFYPWRLADFVKVTSRWLLLVWRYRRIMAKVVSDPAARSYFDEALRPHGSPGETDHFVEVFADKIPHTHGAPVRPAAVAAAE